MKVEQVPIQLTTREQQIYDGLNATHAAEVAELQRQIGIKDSNLETYKSNQRQNTERIAELQDQLLATQTSLTKLQDRLLSLRSIINAPVP